MILANAVFAAVWLTAAGVLVTAGVRLNRRVYRPWLRHVQALRPPAVHQHVHLHSVTAADLAAITAKRQGALPRPRHHQADK